MTTPPGFSAYGAVDLGALAAQRAARERAEAARAEAARAAGDATSGNGSGDTTGHGDGDGDSGDTGAPPAAVAGPAVLDVTEATFQTDVVDRSYTVPVVIDFWAEWCQPCKLLSPILERLADEAAGAWVLVKIDTDANPRISQAFQIQSIPSVFVVWQGQLVPGFTGALPEPEVRRFLDQVALLATEAPPTGDPAAPIDPLEDAALDALDAGDLDGAADAFRRLLDQQPGNEEARLGLARVELMRRTRDADPAEVLAAADRQPDDVEAQALAADVEVQAGRVDDAVDRLVETVRRTSGPEREAARKHLLELFAVLGDTEPAVARGRTALANALF